MSYNVKEVFYTLQGEGGQAGRAAIFIRFIGCNLWNGQEKDRFAPNTVCHFCDTDFHAPAKASGGLFNSAEELVNHALGFWPDPAIPPYIVFTGGEPLLQLDETLCRLFHQKKAILAIETNGTISTDLPLDWLTVSPKAGAPLKQTSGSELKVVFPQKDLNYDELTKLNFSHFFLQPCDDQNIVANIRECIEYIKGHPQWQLSIQMHKMLNIE